MSIRVALNHKTSYLYDRPVAVSPHVIRLRPAAHCRTPIDSYSLQIVPKDHFLNWQQDPHGNFLARCVFTEKVRELHAQVDLVAEMTVINPFDFFLEPSAEQYPLRYDASLVEDLRPYMQTEESGPKLSTFLDSIDRSPRRTNDFLVDVNRRLENDIDYVIRMQPGVQSCEETLTVGRGSCRDTGWLLVQVLRHLGLAARFASGYLIQLKPDVKALDGPVGTDADFTDLHAWAEVYLPGAGWIGLDPTSGLFAGEGHIPLACTPSPISAAPITGSTEPCETEFSFSMSVSRIHEDPRVTKPYTEQQWRRIDDLGRRIDECLKAEDVRLTMGGEPTFVSIDDMESDQWRTAALGPEKRRLANDVVLRLKQRFAKGGLLYYGQGKWYPGESLPRWTMRCYWRGDRQAIWQDPELFADGGTDYGHDFVAARRFAASLAKRLQVDSANVLPAYEDVVYYMWRERCLPVNVDVHDPRLEEEAERQRIMRIFQQGITSPVGCVLPLQYRWWLTKPRWCSGLWQVRSDQMFLIPGDSPMGLRLPVKALVWLPESEDAPDSFAVDPTVARDELPEYEQLRQLSLRRQASVQRPTPEPVAHQRTHSSTSWEDPTTPELLHERRLDGIDEIDPCDSQSPSDIVRTALCVEPREGRLHVFVPPIDHLEHYLDLITAVEATAKQLQTPVVIEGYPPPTDHRLKHISVTPDPGVIEINVHPAHDWDELVCITEGVYEDARQSRLGTEKFDLDGTHTGTGGGNHVVLGGPTPNDSPMLRRPHLLRSLLGYWNNHPSLTYLFSGRFIGPTSQAPRVDEGRQDAIYELKIAFQQIQTRQECAPWLVDRIFRHLLVDGTGNTHRAEFCIDKLYAPESSSGRLGLVEFRSFEMPPHAKMSLTQVLLLRALIARFWNDPYKEELVQWGTSLHDRFMLPHFVWQDFVDVVQETRGAGFDLETDWFAPHFEFRFPKIGELTQRSVHVELRQAIEPWYVLGEEPAAGYVARYVDSSVQRLQVRVRAMTNPRYIITCNGRKLPLHPTGTVGEYVAGVRYRASQPPSCLHPTIPADEPLVFDLQDAWLQRSLGGCRYHVGHPGGLNPDVFPVNAYEAESRRAARFSKMGHTGGPMALPIDEPNPNFPMTLDLRRNRP